MFSRLKTLVSSLGKAFKGFRENGKPTRRAFMANRASLGLEQLEDRSTPALITWTGLGANDLWSNPDNWSLPRAPVAADDIMFKSTSLGDSLEDINFGTAVNSLTIDQYTGTITFSVSPFEVVTMTQSSGIITGNGLFKVVNGAINGSYNWTGGFIGNNMAGDEFVVNIAANATMTIAGGVTMDHGVIEIFGTANWSTGDVIARNSSVFSVRQGGVFNGTAGTATFDGFQFGTNLFQVLVNATYNDINNGHHTFKIDVVLNGTWNVTQGEDFWIKKSTVEGAGSAINITQFGALNLQSDAANASEHFWTGTTVTGLGWLTLAAPQFGEACTLSVSGNVTVSMLMQVRGTLTGTGNLIITKDYALHSDSVWSGGGTATVTINPNATLNVYLTFVDIQPPVMNRRLTNNGTVNFNEVDDLAVGSGMNWVNNGTMNFLDPFNLTPDGAVLATLLNMGTMNVEMTGVVSIALPFTNSGTLNVKAGTTEFTRAVTQNAGSTNLLGGTLRCLQTYHIQSGSFTGSGTIQTLELRNSGLVSPGTTATPVGELTIATLAGVANSGRYVQTATGTISFSLAGTGAGQYDKVHVQGQGSLAGILAVTYVVPYNPQQGDTFDLMDFASLNPMANRFNSTPAGWTTSYPNETGVRIVKN